MGFCCCCQDDQPGQAAKEDAAEQPSEVDGDRMIDGATAPAVEPENAGSKKKNKKEKKKNKKKKQAAAQQVRGFRLFCN